MYKTGSKQSTLSVVYLPCGTRNKQQQFNSSGGLVSWTATKAPWQSHVRVSQSTIKCACI